MRYVSLLLIASSLGLFTSCSSPFEAEIDQLLSESQEALTQLQALYIDGIEADYADLERHASIARTKRFDSLHEDFFRNEFDVLKYHYRQTSRWFELQTYSEWEAQLTLGIQQLENLRHDVEKGLLEDEAVRQAIESEKNALLPLLGEVKTSCASMRELMAKHDSLDNHWQMMWDRWENPTL